MKEGTIYIRIKAEKLELAVKIVITTLVDSVMQVIVVLADKSVHANQDLDFRFHNLKNAQATCNVRRKQQPKPVCL